MSHPSKPGILIVGAGPTGLMAAAQLVRWGIRPRIIDANPAPLTGTRAVAVQARTVEIFQQMGLAEAALANGVKARGVNMFSEKGRLARIPLGDIGEGLSPFPYMLVLSQDRTERILGDDLAAHDLQIEWNTRLAHFSQAANNIQVNLSVNGQMETAEFRYVLGADGAHSALRKGLGIEFEGETYDHRFFVADLRIEGEPVEGELNLFFSNKLAFLGMFPLPGARCFRLVGLLPEALKTIEKPSFEELHPYLRKVAGDRIRFEAVTEFSTYRVHHRVAKQFKTGNCFLLGDAAHVHSPVGGQGMNTGLQDAYNLAWKLALVLRGEADEKLLDTYHDERYPNALKLVGTTDRAFTAIVSMGWQMRMVRDWILPLFAPILLRIKHIQRFAFRTVSQTAISYQGRQLSVDRLGGQIKAGDRFPWFVYDGKDVFKEISGTRFTLFALGEWRAAELAGLRSNLLEPVIINQPAAYTPTGLADGLYLVRPDGYIGYCAKQLNPSEIGEYLKQTIGIYDTVTLSK